MSNLERLSEQLKGCIYDELPQKTQWRVTIYGGVPRCKKNWARSYSVPNLMTGYLLREAIYDEFEALGMLDRHEFLFVYVECFDPNNPEDGWCEWFGEGGSDMDCYEVDENFNIYLLTGEGEG